MPYAVVHFLPEVAHYSALASYLTYLFRDIRVRSDKIDKIYLISNL